MSQVIDFPQAPGRRIVVRPGTATTAPHAGVTAGRRSGSSKPSARGTDPAAPPEQPPAQRSGRVRAIDGYRGLAAICVIVLHATLAGRNLFSLSTVHVLHDLDVCLPVFFVLSGMATYLGIVRGAFTGRPRRAWDMIGGRLWRVLPVYFTIVVLVWSLRYAGTGDDWRDLVLHLTFMQVWSPHFLFWLDGPSWFLSDDMHFFVLAALIAPPVAAFAMHRRRPAVKLGVLAALPLALLAGGLAYMAEVNGMRHVSTQMLYSPLAKLDQFAIGMLLGLVLCLPGVVRPRRWTGAALTALGFALLIGLDHLRWHSHFVQTWDYELTCLPVVVILLGAAMVGEGTVLGRVLTARWLQFFTAVGLTIFLVQEPVMLQLEQWNLLYFNTRLAWWVSTADFLLVSALAAWLLYRLVELPGYRARKLLQEMRRRQRAGERRLSAPPPRRLPDVVLRRPSGEPVHTGELAVERPLLVAIGPEGERRLGAQRFRLIAGDADGVVVAASEDEPTGAAGAEATLLLDPQRRLARALRLGGGLVEVAPGGQITAYNGEPADGGADHELAGPQAGEAVAAGRGPSPAEQAAGDAGDNLDATLGEYLLDELAPHEQQVVAAIYAHRRSERQTARELDLPAHAVRALRTEARAKAREQTLPFAESMLCEPAALAQAHTPAARREAVADHVSSCRACRAEFEQRVDRVLAAAGQMSELHALAS